MADDCASERCCPARQRAAGAEAGGGGGRCGRRGARLSRGARGAGAAGPPGRSQRPGQRAAFPCRLPVAKLCAPPRESPRASRVAAHRPERPGPAASARAASAAPSHANGRLVWWSEPGGGRGGRWRRAGAARARPGAAFAARGGAGSPRRAAARPDALMEPPWEVELELRRHIESCACTCDHMGYGNYMDYQVPPAHACLCRAITSPHAHVRVLNACTLAAPSPARMIPGGPLGTASTLILFVVFTPHVIRTRIVMLVMCCLAGTGAMCQCSSEL